MTQKEGEAEDIPWIIIIKSERRERENEVANNKRNEIKIITTQ